MAAASMTGVEVRSKEMMKRSYDELIRQAELFSTVNTDFALGLDLIHRPRIEKSYVEILLSFDELSWVRAFHLKYFSIASKEYKIPPALDFVIFLKTKKVFEMQSQICAINYAFNSDKNYLRAKKNYDEAADVLDKIIRLVRTRSLIINEQIFEEEIV